MKTVLITGGSRGIGAATALWFAEHGYAVAVHYRHGETEARAVVRQCMDKRADADLFQAELSDSIAVNAMVDAVVKRFGHVDVLVNNAGMALSKLLTDLTDDDWHQVMNVDLSGAFYTMRAVLPAMIRRHSGSIVNVSSMWGQTGASMETAYAAAKAGLIGLTKAVAKEVAPSGIRVNAVAPGVVDTRMNRHLTETELAALAEEIPLGRVATPDEVAAAIGFLAGENASYITGQVLGVNGGMVI